MELKYEENTQTFFCVCTYAEKDIPKAAGFMWEPRAKRWQTKIIDKAIKLAAYAHNNVRDMLAEAHQKMVESVEQSHLTDANITIPVPAGLAYLPFQKAGIAYALNKFIKDFNPDLFIYKNGFREDKDAKRSICSQFNSRSKGKNESGVGIWKDERIQGQNKQL
jgi:hypothetical protein